MWHRHWKLEFVPFTPSIHFIEFVYNANAANILCYSNCTAIGIQSNPIGNDVISFRGKLLTRVCNAREGKCERVNRTRYHASFFLLSLTNRLIFFLVSKKSGNWHRCGCNGWMIKRKHQNGCIFYQFRLFEKNQRIKWNQLN